MGGVEGVVGFAEEVGEEEGVSGEDFVGALAWKVLLVLSLLWSLLGLYGGKKRRGRSE